MGGGGVEIGGWRGVGGEKEREGQTGLMSFHALSTSNAPETNSFFKFVYSASFWCNQSLLCLSSRVCG